MTNEYQDTRAYWLMRAGRLNEKLQRRIRDDFRDVMKPRDKESRTNVAALADGQLVALWIAAAMEDPEWGQRAVAWMVSTANPAVQQSLQEVRAAMAFTLEGEPEGE